MSNSGTRTEPGSSLIPSLSVAVKLASLAVHADEGTKPGGHVFDRIAIEGILEDPEVVAYLAALDAAALLPKRRGS